MASLPNIDSIEAIYTIEGLVERGSADFAFFEMKLHLEHLLEAWECDMTTAGLA